MGVFDKMFGKKEITKPVEEVKVVKKTRSELFDEEISLNGKLREAGYDRRTYEDDFYKGGGWILRPGTPGAEDLYQWFVVQSEIARKTPIQLLVTDKFNKGELFNQNPELVQELNNRRKSKVFDSSLEDPMALMGEMLKSGSQFTMAMKIESLPEKGTDEFKYLSNYVFGTSRSFMQHNKMNWLVVGIGVNTVEVPELNSTLVGHKTLNPRK